MTCAVVEPVIRALVPARAGQGISLGIQERIQILLDPRKHQPTLVVLDALTIDRDDVASFRRLVIIVFGGYIVLVRC